VNKILVLLSMWGLAACGEQTAPGEEKGADVLPRFVDVAAEAGVVLRTVSGTPAKGHIVECNTGGVAVFDYDNDGDADLFIVNGSRLEGFGQDPPPRATLYRNDGDWRFTDVGAETGIDHLGWGMGATVVDYNADGWFDLYLSNYGPNALYRNNGDGTFTDVAAEAGVDYPGWSSAAVFADYDLDGDLDFYLTNYMDFDPEYVPGDMSFCSWHGISVFYGPRGMPGDPDRFYRNEGSEQGWSFTEASQAVGMSGHDYYAFAAVAGDFDNDGDQDIYIANDSTPNLLYRNEGGIFKDVSLITATAYSEDGREQGGMGLATADYDLDGDFDIFVTNFSHDNNTLYRNNGKGYFVDASFMTVLGKASISYLGWGTGFFDFDNDGDEDLFVANGHVYPAVDQADLGTTYNQRNQFFVNDGRGGFFEVTDKVGPGAEIEKSSRGSAFGDFDNDGDLDVVVVNIDDTPTLLRNDIDGGHWLMVRLRGDEGNAAAVGARVKVETGGKVQMREARAGTGYISQDDSRLHFGLGQEAVVQRLVVRWPDGLVETIEQVAADRLVTVARGRGIVAEGFGPVGP
jgi:enediyne biosynthesis protein E4